MSTRVNVLVYAGNGTTVESVKHATWSLRRALGPNYAVITVTGDQILKEPWTQSCALLVVPGGADLGYSRTLNGAGNRRIKQYVQLGGAYLGFCAGGYYGSARCEFEVGDKSMEVVGDRELAFFPGTCRGLVFPGFKYHSEAGMRAAQLEVDTSKLPTSDSPTPGTFRAYYNGGGVFVDANTFGQRGIEVLANYTEPMAVEGGQGRAAVVYCKVGEGAAILTGPHFEFSGHNLPSQSATGPPDYVKAVDALVAEESLRLQFMKDCLKKLGLVTASGEQSVPSLSRLHVSAMQPALVADLLSSWYEADIITKQEDGSTIEGENDKFILEQQDSNTWSVQGLAKAIEQILPTSASQSAQADAVIDFNAIPKGMLLHDKAIPDNKETPHFNHNAFYANLRHFQAQTRGHNGDFGKHILYGEVVTSTSTLLEKNPRWLAHLPNGLTATATTQVAGRGRGSNVWVSPPGSLMFSTVMRHPITLSTSAPVVFVQYLAALAIVAGVQGYDRGYDKIPIKLKWPNDIYVLNPAQTTDQKYVKIGGILVNSSYSGGDYTLVCGIGVNVNNTAPTTSLSMLAKEAGLPPFTLEKLLAAILVHFEALYTRFCRTGFDAQFLDQYYRSWLHSNQVVTLETENGARARIKGVTKDWGLLLAEELGWEDRPTGRTFELQSDSNSFDFFKGLLKRKT